jgi:hypothetical protein
MFFTADKAIRKSANIFIKFNFTNSFKVAKGSLLTGFAMLIAILIFLSPKIIGGKIQVPRSLFEKLVPVAENLYKTQSPGFSSDMTVDEFIFLEALSGNNFPGAKDLEIKNYDDLKETIRLVKQRVNQQVINKSLNQPKQDLSRMSGKRLKGSEKMKDVIYDTISRQLSLSLKSYQNIVGVTIGLVLFFFLILKGILSIVGLIYLPVAWIFFTIFRRNNFFKIETVSVNQEKLII